MAKRKGKEKRDLIAKASPSTGLTVEQVMSHQMVVDMSKRLEDVKAMLSQLPEAVGRAVAEAMGKSKAGFTPPSVPVSSAETVEFLPQKLTVDGKTTELPKVKHDVGSVSKYLANRPK